MRILILLMCFLTLLGCTAKIYVIDRHTIMEDEAAGVWPQFDKDILAGAKREGPTPFKKTDLSGQKNRLYNIPNGEATTQSAQGKK